MTIALSTTTMNCAEDNNPSAAQRFVELTVRIADPRPCRELRRLHPPDIKAPARTRRRQECLHYLFLRCDPGPAGRARGSPIARVATISPVMADPARNGPRIRRRVGSAGARHNDAVSASNSLVLSKMAPIHVMLELRNDRITY